MTRTAILLDHSADWHERRRQGIGASDAVKIMSGDWLELWEIKTRRREPEDLSNVLPVQLGAFTEPFNLAWFERQTGTPVREFSKQVVHSELTYIRCELDGVTGSGVAIEAKHVSAFAKEEEILARYHPQLQHILACTGDESMILTVLYGTLKWDYYEIPRDQEYIAELITRETLFWSHVTGDTPPPTVGAVAVEIAFDDMREEDMSGSNEWASAAHDWLENKAGANLFKAAEKSLKELVKADVKRAYGNEIEIKRAKNGAMRIGAMK